MEHSLERDEQSAAPPTPTGELDAAMATSLAGRTGSRRGRSSIDGQGRQLGGISGDLSGSGRTLPAPTKTLEYQPYQPPYRRPGAPPSHSFTCAHSLSRQASALTTRRTL